MMLHHLGFDTIIVKLHIVIYNNIVDREGTPESKKDSIIVSDDAAENQLINVT